MKASRVTTELGFPGASKAADLGLCRDHAATVSSKIFSVYLRQGLREGCIFMMISALQLKIYPPVLLGGEGG